MAFFYIKKRKLWVIKAYNRAKNAIISWATGSRSAKTFRKAKYLKGCTFYTGSWDVFSKVLSKAKHIIGRQHTVWIERDNINVYNDLARSTRRTKVVSKSEKMVNNPLNLWQPFQTSNLFSSLRQIFLSVLK